LQDMKLNDSARFLRHSGSYASVLSLKKSNFKKFDLRQDLR